MPRVELGLLVPSPHPSPTTGRGNLLLLFAGLRAARRQNTFAIGGAAQIEREWELGAGALCDVLHDAGRMAVRREARHAARFGLVRVDRKALVAASSRM